MAAITEAEKILISKLRENVKDLNLSEIQNDEKLLIRWIRGRDHNLDQAGDMLRNAMKFREANGFDTLQQWKAPASVRRDYPLLVSGVDKEGCPVGYVRFGVWDVKRLIATGQREVFIKYMDQLFDALLGKVHPNGNTQMVLLVDMEHYSFRQVTAFGAVEAILAVIKRFESNYPETLKRCIIFNASRVFTVLYSVIKPILPPRTASKVEILGNNASKWKAQIQELVPLAELPTQYGGTNLHVQNRLYGNGKKTVEVDGNENECDSEFEFGEITEINVAAGTEAKFDYDVTEPYSILKWIFMTDSYDIGFSVHLENKEEEEVFKYKKYDSQSKEQGFLLCERAGKYTLCFDNKYSRLRSKTIRYAATLIPQGKSHEDSL